MKKWILAVVILVALPGTSLSIPCNYLADGSFYIDDINYSVSGHIIIDNEFKYSPRSEQSDGFHSFDISNFSLLVEYPGDQFNFHGDLGILMFLEQILDPNTGKWVGEWMWGLTNSTTGENWSNAYSPAFTFLDSSGEIYSPLDEESFGVLAPTINLSGPLFASNLPYPSYVMGGQITLTQAAPVPEPGTILLVGSGLAGMLMARRKRTQ